MLIKRWICKQLAMHDRLHAPIGSHGNHIAAIGSDMNNGTCGVDISNETRDFARRLADDEKTTHGIVLVLERFTVRSVFRLHQPCAGHVGERCGGVVGGREAVQPAHVVHGQLTRSAARGHDVLRLRVVAPSDADAVAGAVNHRH